MTIELRIDENDYLTHQLFAASKSERIKRKRRRNKIIVPIIYAFLGSLFLIQERNSLAIMFFIFAFFWFLFYPFWEKHRYIKHYKGFIKENLKDTLGRSTILEFNYEFIIAKDDSSEAKVFTTEVEEINEIPSTIFIRFKGGHSFILPKNKIADIDSVKAYLKDLASNLKIKYEIEENWKWK